MDILNNNNYEWKLVAKEKDEIIVEYSCPVEIIGDMIKILSSFHMGETVTPHEIVIQRFQELIKSNLITLKAVSKLTGLDDTYLKQMLEGKATPIDTKKICELTGIIEKIRLG